MATEQQLSVALVNAHNAGDVEAARTLAGEIMRLRRSASQQPTQASKPDLPWYQDVAGYLNKGLQSVASGATAGFADEIAATLDAPFVAGYRKIVEGQPFDMGKARDDRLAAYRKDLKEFRDENPGSALTAEIAGGVASPLNKIVAPFAIGAKGAGMAANMARAGAAGAGMGALYGAGNAEGSFKDRAVGAAEGAALGGVVGAASVPVVKGLEKVGGFVMDQTVNRLPFRQESAAMRKLAEALERDGLTIDQVRTRINEIGPEAALMDIGPNTRALMAAAYQTPGEGKKILNDFLTARQEGTRGVDKVLSGGQANRIASMLDDLVPEDLQAARESAAASRKAMGKNYNAARESGNWVDIQGIVRELDDEIRVSKGGIRSSLQKVRDLMVDGSGNPEAEIGILHQVKIAIDDFMSGEGKSSVGNVAKTRIKDYQNKLVQAIEEAGEGGAKYRAGRLGTAAAWRIDDALTAGEQFMLKRTFASPEEMAAAVGQMIPEEQHAFRIGAAQAIKNKLMDITTRADGTKRIMDIPALEQKIRLAFGNDDLFRKYISALEGEREMFASYAAAKGNSATAERTAAMADAAKDPGRIIQGLREIFAPHSVADPIRGLTNVFGGTKDRLTMPAPISGRLARILTGTNADDIGKIYQQGQANENMRRSLAQLLVMGGGVSGGRIAAP